MQSKLTVVVTFMKSTVRSLRLDQTVPSSMGSAPTAIGRRLSLFREQVPETPRPKTDVGVTPVWLKNNYLFKLVLGFMVIFLRMFALLGISKGFIQQLDGVNYFNFG